MIIIKDLCFRYLNTDPYVLNNINFSIMKGQYISILGSNGSGKTTFIKLLLQLLTPSSGSIIIDTYKIGYVPQKNDSFNSQFPITVNEMMDCHRKILKIKNKSIIDESLSSVGMENFKTSLMGTLSGGQRQKVFIARALMGQPELLVFDEPSTGVDVKSQEDIYTTIRTLNTSKNIAVISVEHNLKAALSYSNFIYYIENGEGSMLKPNDYMKMISGGNSYATV